MPNQTDQKAYRNALQNLLCCRPVAYYPSLARVVGGASAALMLSQLIYWNGVTSGEVFFKSVAEMTAETELTEDEQATARKKLIACGAVIAKRSGWPATWHYQVDLDRIAELLSIPPNRPQIPALQESGNTGILQQRNPTTQESGNAGIRQRKNPVKSGNRFRENRNLTEGAINELNTENTSETTGEEEEGPIGQNFQILDDQIIQELLDFGVFQSKLIEVDRAGWTPDQLRELMRKCLKQDKLGTPAALLLKRIQEWKPPRASIGYPQYNSDQEDPAEWAPIIDAYDRVIASVVGADHLDELEYYITPKSANPLPVDIAIVCPTNIWSDLIAPNADLILQQIQPLGVSSLSLAS